MNNIPRDNIYRNCFYTDAGMSSCDYSSMEIRRVAELANETHLIESANAGLDFHLETAKKLFDLEGKDPDYISKKRHIGKTLNFSIIYGVSAFKLSRDYGVSIKEAEGWINSYFKANPNIKKFLDKTRAYAVHHGHVVIDNYGRIAYFKFHQRLLELTSFLERVERLEVDYLLSEELLKALRKERLQIIGSIERESGNYIVQGSCAAITKLAQIKLYQMNIVNLIQVYDEILVDGNHVDALKECMQSAWNVFNKKVEMPITAEYHSHWVK